MNLKTKLKDSSKRWGGARAGAGRKKTSVLAPHASRQEIELRRFPVFITLRLRPHLPSLQNPDIYSQFHRAALRARGFGLRIIHFAIHSQKIFLLCEFKDRKELEKSFKSLNTALAVALKKQAQKEGQEVKGPVFLGRFLMEVIEEPRRLKSVLREIFFNSPDLPHDVDDFEKLELQELSSAAFFQHWRSLLKDESLKMPLKIDQKVSYLIQTLDEEKYLPNKRIAQEITSTPQFLFTKKALAVAT